MIRQDGDIVAEHSQFFGRGETTYDPWNHVQVLARANPAPHAAPLSAAGQGAPASEAMRAPRLHKVSLSSIVGSKRLSLHRGKA